MQTAVSEAPLIRQIINTQLSAYVLWSDGHLPRIFKLYGRVALLSNIAMAC